MQGKLSGFMNKAKETASAAGGQASTMWKDGSSRASTGSQGIMAGFSLPGESAKAAKILKSFLGLAVFTILKAGFVFSGKAGSGLVVARLPDGSWSAPSCIATAGVGWGLQIGADITEVVIVLNSDEAVKAFSRGGNVTVGGGISAAAGPIGTGGQVQASLANPAPMFSYSRSKGLFAGLTLDGTILVERKDANRDFYGSAISATDILSGRVPPPEIAGEMYDTIEAAEGIDESTVPSQAFVPGQAGQQLPVQPAAFPGAGQPLGATGVPGHGNHEMFNADKH